jgi:hypothetical protein
MDRPVDVWVCQSCGSAFLRPTWAADEPEARIAHIEEMETVPEKW